MIAAFLAVLAANRRKKTEDVGENLSNGPAEYTYRSNSLVASSVAYCGSISIGPDKFIKKTTLINICLSASGVGKWEIIKNDAVIATVFSSNEHKNVFYPGELKLKVGDTLKFVCHNMERQYQDMYVGFDLKEKQ